MKVVLFCGGYGMRMREGANSPPKPMVMIGDRPLLWHVMRYYAHFGHTEFILCLGFGAGHIKDFFLSYREAYSNDFTLSNGGQDVELLTSDILDWRITFVDTGLDTTIGERLVRVRKYVADDEMFLANYADVLTDAPLPEIVGAFRASDAVGCLLAVPPRATFHVVNVAADNRVQGIQAVNAFPLWENGGYFVFRSEIFDYLSDGEDLVDDGLRRLVADGRLMAHRHTGFWQPADTFKERAELEAMHYSGQRPWALWDVDRRSGLVATSE